MPIVIISFKRIIFYNLIFLWQKNNMNGKILRETVIQKNLLLLGLLILRHNLRMKKIFSIILIFVLFYSIMGFYLSFQIEQIRIKEEIKEKIISNLPENELILIKIPSFDSKKITWVEDGKEFRYESNMFDVVKIKKGIDTTYYYCFCDVKESKLLAHLDKLIKEQTDNSQSRSNLKKQEINYFFHEILFTQCLTKTPVVYFIYPSSYESIVTDVLSPPPRISGTI